MRNKTNSLCREINVGLACIKRALLDYVRMTCFLFEILSNQYCYSALSFSAKNAAVIHLSSSETIERFCEWFNVKPVTHS